MKKASVLDYTFAVAKARALEKFLIKEGVFQEAIDGDLAGALRLFVESDLYSDELLHVKDSLTLENILNQELLKLKNLIGDLILDKPLLGLLELKGIECVQEIMKNYPNVFLEDYLRQMIDMHNIKSFLRLYVLKEPKDKLETVLICEGFIQKEDFLKLYEQDLSYFLNRLAYVHKHQEVIDYAFFLKEAIEKLRKENSFVVLEKVMQDFLIEALKPAKYITFGPEPLIAYYFAKVNEINLMRMIILAKLNDVPGDLIKERLNAVYA